MKRGVKDYWNVILRIGHHPGMDQTQEMRLFVLNAFITISFGLTILFVIIFTILGSYSSLQGLFVLPALTLILYCNYKRKYQLARFLVIYSLLLLVLLLALADRRTGTEYILIALGCCSVMVFERLVMIILSFLVAFSCYAFYVWFDASHPFTPDPSTPYILVQNSLMFLSGVAVVAQSFVFRSVIRKYAESLKSANDEIGAVNEELKASNEQLKVFSEDLDLLVREKSAQLQAYVDAINASTCSVILNLEGIFTTVNDPFVSISGYTREELLGKRYDIFNSGQYTERFLRKRDGVLLSGRVWSGELKYLRKDGSFFWIDCVVMPLKTDTGNVSAFLSVGIPITERKLNQQIKEKTRMLLEEIAYRTSHKIRGPLATMEGLTMLVRNKLVSADEFEMIAQKLALSNEDLKEATSELVRFVNDHQTEAYR